MIRDQRTPAPPSAQLTATADPRGQAAACAYAGRLCDSIDRSRLALADLGEELRGAVDIARALGAPHGSADARRTVERAERLLEQLENGS